MPPAAHRNRPTVRTWVGAVTGLAMVVLIAFTLGFDAASFAVGAILLVYALLLLVMGRAARFVPGDIRTARSNGATRMLGLAAAFISAYVLFGAVTFARNALPPLDVLWSMLILAIGCAFAAQFIAWRSIQRDASHADRGKRPYFVGGAVPVSRLGAGAALIGVVSLAVAWLAMGAFISLPVVVIPLGSVAVAAGIVAFARAWVRRPASRAVPVLAVVAGLVSMGITGAVASNSADIQGIACVSPTDCLGVGQSLNTGFYVPVSSGQRGNVVSIPGSKGLNAIACPTSTSCIAVGSDSRTSGGVVVEFHRNGSRGWTAGGALQVSATLNGVACTSSTACLAVGSGVVSLSAGIPGAVQHVPAGVSLDAVACPAPGSCQAVGATNNNIAAVWTPIAGGELGAITRIGGSAGLFAIACPNAATCWAVGEGSGYGVAMEIVGGKLGSAQVLTAVEEASSISCPTAALCVAAGYATGGLGPSQALVALSSAGVGASSILGGGSVQPMLACFTRACLVTGTPVDDGVTVAPLP